jgi:hypothetical protein
MQDLLKSFCQNHGLSDSKITESRAKWYVKCLSCFPDTLVINKIEELRDRFWDKRYLPLPKTIYDLCQVDDELTGRKEREEQKQQRSEKQQEWQTRKFRHRHALKDVVERLIGGTPLTGQQKEAVETVTPYMTVRWDGDWISKVDYKDEKQKLTPITVSFIGLYMDTLEGTLDRLSGVKRGNIF